MPFVLNIVDGGGATKETCKIELQRETTTLWVSGSENKLRDLTQIELGTVNLAELKEESNTLIFDIVLPEGVTNMSGETQVTAVITFPELGTKKLTLSKAQFRAAGVPEGAEALWISEMVDVELRGPKDLVKSVTENSRNAYQVESTNKFMAMEDSMSAGSADTGTTISYGKIQITANIAVTYSF